MQHAVRTPLGVAGAFPNDSVSIGKPATGICAAHPPSRAPLERFSSLYRPWILRRCMRRLENHHDAEDAAQEVLVRVIRALPRFEGRCGIRAWLAVVVDNTCRTVAARAGRRVLAHATEPEWEKLPSTAPNFAERWHRANHVARALARVPVASRQVLQLRFFHDQPLAEIAETLKISLSAAKMRLYRGQADFRRHYREMERDVVSQAA